MTGSTENETERFLDGLVDVLTVAPRDVPEASVSNSVDVGRARTFLVNTVEQAPIAHAERVRLLAGLQLLTAEFGPSNDAAIIEAAARLAGAAPRYPTSSGGPLDLPTHLGLDGAVRTLIDLDRSVSAPWTLIGGLMVLVHCLEHDAPHIRPTEDADIAVNVFTHRRAVRLITQQLTAAGFEDRTPDPLPGAPRLSYRWARDEVIIDIAVPPRANDQRTQATTVAGRPAVELVATQQALRRTERIAVVDGHIRRPDLLGAIVIKSAAAGRDRRDPARHLEDLVTLADILAFSGRQLDLAAQTTAKDRQRIRRALDRVTAQQWRPARDPEAARAALVELLE